MILLSSVEEQSNKAKKGNKYIHTKNKKNWLRPSFLGKTIAIVTQFTKICSPIFFTDFYDFHSEMMGFLLGKDFVAGFPSLNKPAHTGTLLFHKILVHQSKIKGEIFFCQVFKSKISGKEGDNLEGLRLYQGAMMDQEK
ncbi:uncharacterized protein VP01_263g4 [Puccinia sorghi]|uniref:Uncharacterized protein n=1 Tax=Puccinia sorghi TaxID=27349 RepID=A0A0L6V498_9BASI|nr:uncharacterized protein VP01_263g4 [Puccinia sorghi]